MIRRSPRIPASSSNLADTRLTSCRSRLGRTKVGSSTSFPPEPIWHSFPTAPSTRSSSLTVTIRCDPPNRLHARSCTTVCHGRSGKGGNAAGMTTTTNFEERPALNSGAVTSCCTLTRTCSMPIISSSGSAVSVLKKTDAGRSALRNGGRRWQTHRVSTLPDFPAEIRAPAGSLPRVSGFQLHFADHDIITPGDAPNVLVAMNPAALKTNIADLPRGGTLIVDADAFTERNLAKAGYEQSPLEDGSLDEYQVHAVPAF